MAGFGDYSACCIVPSFIVFFILLLVVVIMYAFKSRGDFKKVLKSLAVDAGCSYVEGGCGGSPKVSGTFRNRSIVVDSYTEHHRGGNNSSSTTYTRLQVGHSGAVHGMEVYPETFFSSIGKKLGMQDVQTGNPMFDKVFVVKGGDERKVKEVLDLDMQQKLLMLKMPVQVLSDKIYMRKVGYITDKSLLVNMLNLMADLAERIEKVR